MLKFAGQRCDCVMRLLQVSGVGGSSCDNTGPRCGSGQHRGSESPASETLQCWGRSFGSEIYAECPRPEADIFTISAHMAATTLNTLCYSEQSVPAGRPSLCLIEQYRGLSGSPAGCAAGPAAAAPRLLLSDSITHVKRFNTNRTCLD